MKDKIIYLVLGGAIGWLLHASPLFTADKIATPSQGEPSIVHSTKEAKVRERSTTASRKLAYQTPSNIADQIKEINEHRSSLLREQSLSHFILNLSTQDFPEALLALSNDPKSYEQEQEIEESQCLAFCHWFSLDPQAATQFIDQDSETFEPDERAAIIRTAHHFCFHQDPENHLSEILKLQADQKEEDLTNFEDLLYLVGRWNEDPIQKLSLIKGTLKIDSFADILANDDPFFDSYTVPSMIRGLIESGRSESTEQLTQQFPESANAVIETNWQNISQQRPEQMKAFAEAHPEYLKQTFRKIVKDSPEEATNWLISQARRQGSPADLTDAAMEIVGTAGPFSTESGPEDPFSGPAIDYDRATDWLRKAEADKIPTDAAWHEILEHSHHRSSTDDFISYFEQAPETAREQFRIKVFDQASSPRSLGMKLDIGYLNQRDISDGRDRLAPLGLEEDFIQKAIEINTEALRQLEEQLLPDE